MTSPGTCAERRTAPRTSAAWRPERTAGPIAAYSEPVVVPRAAYGPIRVAVGSDEPFTGSRDALFDRIGPQQRARYELLRGPHADLFLHGRALVAEILDGFTPGDCRIVTRCPTCGSAQHGPLHTVSGAVSVSVSYAAGAVAPATCSGVSESLRAGGFVGRPVRAQPMTGWNFA